ncbi:MAG: metallophosphoesterase [Bacteroidia bacterium]
MKKETEIKTITIGDLHGRNDWKYIYFAKYDKIIFIGDYVDSRYYTDAEILANLKHLIELKELHPDRFVLLLGNHDIQYLYPGQFPCSGFRPKMEKKLHKLFNDNKAKFQVAFQLNNYLWTHAGVSKDWYEKHLKTINKFKSEHHSSNLADILNLISNSEYYYILHTPGYIRGGKYGSDGGITWADIKETKKNHLKGYHQIVGHTKVDSIIRFGRSKSSITYVDCLETEIKFHELKINDAEVNFPT